MGGRAAERVERVSEMERVVGIGMAAMVEGRVGVIVRSLLVSLNNLVCTVQVVMSVLKMSLKLLSILCIPNLVFLMVMPLASIVTRGSCSGSSSEDTSCSSEISSFSDSSSAVYSSSGGSTSNRGASGAQRARVIVIPHSHHAGAYSAARGLLGHFTGRK